MANSSIANRLAKLQKALDTQDAITEAASTRDLARVVLFYAGNDAAEAELCSIVPGLKEIFAGIRARPPEESTFDAEMSVIRSAAHQPVAHSGVPLHPREQTPEEIAEQEELYRIDRKEQRAFDWAKRAVRGRIVRRKPD